MTISQADLIQRFLRGEPADDIPSASNMEARAVNGPPGRAAIVSLLPSRRRPGPPYAILLRHEGGSFLLFTGWWNGRSRHRRRVRNVVRNFYREFGIDIDIEDAVHHVTETTEGRNGVLHYENGDIIVFEERGISLEPTRQLQFDGGLWRETPRATVG